MKIGSGLALAGVVASFLGATTSTATPPAAVTQYLAFQVFTGGPDPRQPIGSSGTNALPPPPTKVAIANFVDDILLRIGVTGTRQRKLAFIEGPIAFDHSDDEVSRLIREGFDTALARDIAVGFHLDDSMFWARRTDLWKDINNVEWLDWGRTPNSGRRIDWSEHPTKFPPQMCLNSQAIQKEVARRATVVIGKAVREGVQRLTRASKEELFAGVIVGWETHIGRDFATNRSLGYCALSNRGFGEHNPPADADREREEVVKDFIERWAKGLADAGVDTRKVYSHTAFMSKRSFAFVTRAGGPSYSQLNHFAPPWVAFGKYHSPGFSTYPQIGLMTQIYEELQRHGNPPWASAEGTNLQIAGNSGTAMSMESYLAQMYNHGATFVNIFAWGIGGEAARGNHFRRATEGAGALAAYRKFLKGDLLGEYSPPEPKPEGALGVSSLSEKMQRAQAWVARWEKDRRDLSAIAPLMQQVEAHLKMGRVKEAEATLDQMLSVLDGSSTAPSSPSGP